jgi:hypothetical protein
MSKGGPEWGLFFSRQANLIPAQNASELSDGLLGMRPRGDYVMLSALLGPSALLEEPDLYGAVSDFARMPPPVAEAELRLRILAEEAEVNAEIDALEALEDTVLEDDEPDVVPMFKASLDSALRRFEGRVARIYDP